MENKKSLKEKILSDENIFSAIYSLESYISEINLLSEDDLKLFYKLKDKYNKKLIEETIDACKILLEQILYDKEYFKIQVYFKAKKWDDDNNCIKYRPMHTASLITQICIVCLLNQIMFKESKDGKRELSDLAQLIPDNFYGNIPTLEPERIFYDWRVKYKEYTEKVIRAYAEASQNHTYKYEVALDLVNFFPSVNPKVLYNLCLKKIGYLYQDEIDDLKLVLRKLLKFKITNLNSKNSLKKYYDKDYPDLQPYSIGIPQGLPQSYFFGNLCMTIIYKKFNDIFPGEAFYYVDDSTIYTNSENANENNFYKSIKKLNKAIKEEMKKYGVNPSKGRYVIEVHKGNKSTSSEIQNTKKLSKAFLTLIAKEASGVGYDIKNTMETLEDIVLSKKLEELEKAVDCELDNLSKYYDNEKKVNDKEEKNNFCVLYKKSLNRYKKFFKYRKYLLKYRNDKECSMLEKEFQEIYFIKDFTNENRKQIMKHMDADNFLAEAQLIFASKMNNEAKEEFKNNIKNFEKRLMPDVDEENLYFKENFKFVNLNISPYDSLDMVTKEKIKDFSRANIDNAIEFMYEHINDMPNLIGYGQKYDRLICLHSNEYKRKIYNACISRIFNIYLSDDLQIYKKDNRNITYYELCLFAHFRNKASRMDNIILPERVLKDEKIGYDVYEVLYLFVTYVKKPEYIYHLLLIHRYISSIWKNGSRFLYFYTLHNQEHSIELIKRVVSLCKVIDYFQLKNEDFYILFLCCYLHDVSMAIQPQIESFTADNEQTDIISTKFYSELKRTIELTSYDKEATKKLMKQAFEMVNEYFESVARDQHAYDSASFIKNNIDLFYLDPTVRKEVAAISEAHCYNSIDVFDLKSVARTECISEKYLMILLRLADLVDGAKDRVSLNILRHNISNMPEESKFHWVTHAITDGVDITSEYRFETEHIPTNENEFISVLNKKYLNEIIVVTINVNEYNLTNVTCNKCRNAHAKLVKKENKILIDIGKEETCDEKTCTFLCKWLMTKNSYLLSELNALQLYFNRNASNLFNTKIQIKINFSNAQSIDSKYYDIVDKKINN